MTTYIIIFVLLLLAELIYFRIADKYNIIDKPNQRSSHSTIVLRGGGIIFLIGAWIWSAFFGFEYPWFLAGVTLIAGVSFVDGINGITAGYSLAVLLPLAALNADDKFVAQSLIFTTIIAAIVFCIFNFRPKGKAKCFAGDVGSIGIAFIMLFLLGNVIIKTEDITWLIFLLVYGVSISCIGYRLRTVHAEILSFACGIPDAFEEISINLQPDNRQTQKGYVT